jgi:3-deoxy-7-phosphoheptulonate synthase
MLVVMQAQATEEQVRAVCEKIESLGYRPHSIPGAQRTAIGITGNKGEIDSGALEELPGVQEVIRVTKPYKLVSRDTKPDTTIVRFPTSHALLLIPSRAWARRACRSWPRFAIVSDC